MSDTTVLDQSKESTEMAEFAPTPAMRVWLDTAIELMEDSPTEIARQSGIDKSTWYKWLKLDGFEDWYYANYKQQRRRWLPTLDKIGMTNAKRDYNYWKDMNRKVGETEEKTPTTAVQINFNANKYLKER